MTDNEKLVKLTKKYNSAKIKADRATLRAKNINMEVKEVKSIIKQKEEEKEERAQAIKHNRTHRHINYFSSVVSKKAGVMLVDMEKKNKLNAKLRAEARSLKDYTEKCKSYIRMYEHRLSIKHDDSFFTCYPS